jgi:arylsulfatase A-like enzyme
MEDSVAMRGSVGRLVQTSRVLVPTTLLAWILLVMFGALTARGFPGVHALALMAGGYGLAAWLVLAIALIPLSFFRVERAQGTSFDRRAFLALAVTALLGAAVMMPLRPPLWDLIPVGMAYPDELARAASFYLALALGAAIAWVMWRLLPATRGSPFPLWTFAVLHCGARMASSRDLELAAPGREGLFDAALLVVFGAATLGVGGRLPTATVRVLGASWALSVIALVTTISGSEAARSQLFTTYPGAASLVHNIRSLIDFDGDGAASILAGTDCDDLDPERHPFALEIVGDGIDQNCNGFDLASAAQVTDITRRDAAPKHNVVIITVDTVRFDLLNRSVMPNLTRLSTQGATFTRSYAAAPHTSSSMNSMLTGFTTMSHSLRWNESVGLEPTLTERLHDEGYTTAIVMYDWWGTGRPWDIHRGFERVMTLTAAEHDSYRTVTGPKITEGALSELARLTAQPKPFFLWIHYLDPHAEYVPRDGTPFSQRDDLRSRYWQEVWATDRELGQVFDALEAAHFFDDGLLVVHSDHGELVEDHGRTGHAYWLDEAVLRTLLVLRGPDIPRGRYETRVRLVDVAPTVLDVAAGLETPSTGRSMRPVLAHRERDDREVVVHTTYQNTNQSALIAANHKLIKNDVLGISYLYDLTSDRAEAHNLIDERPEVAARLRARLAEA